MNGHGLPRAAGHSPVIVTLAESARYFALGLIPYWCPDGLLDRLVVQTSTLSRSFFSPYLSFSFGLV
jgi:hypothetical protein